MSILSDTEISELCIPTTNESYRPMIQPFYAECIRYNSTPVISYGLSSYGYDVTLSEDLRVFTNHNSTVINPKNIDKEELFYVPVIKTGPEGDYVILPPHSYMLGHTKENFIMPEDVTGICLGKSTYARSGILINATPIEAGWEGQIVIEIANITSIPAMVFVNEGIAQILFFKGSQKCATSYAQRDGKYMHQSGVTHATV